MFRVRNIPAALYKALGGFATNGVNMTKLESYMVEGAVHRHHVLSRKSMATRTTCRCSGRSRSSGSSRANSAFSALPAHAFRDTFKEVRE